MKPNKSLWAAILAAGALLTITPAAQAQARSSVSISYRSYDHRGDWRRDYREYRRDRRHRYHNRRGWYGWNDGYRSRHRVRCHNEWRWDRWRDRRVRVRICR